MPFFFSCPKLLSKKKDRKKESVQHVEHDYKHPVARGGGRKTTRADNFFF